MAPAETATPLPQTAAIKERLAARFRGKTVKFRIDKFEELEGPIFVSAWTLAPAGQWGEKVYEEWVHGPEFTISLNAKQQFPISIGGQRTPMSIGDRIPAKETGEILYHAKPETWTAEAYWRGSEICSVRGFCEHEDRGYRCPRAVFLTAGVVKHGRGTWILREDGPPALESDLDELRGEEEKAKAQKDREIAAKMKRAASHTPPQPVTRTPEPLGVDLIYGSSGPVEDAVGGRTGA